MGGAALIPLAIASISYLTRGGFVSDESLLNKARPIVGPRVQAADTEEIDPRGTESDPHVAQPTGVAHCVTPRCLLGRSQF